MEDPQKTLSQLVWGTLAKHHELRMSHPSIRVLLPDQATLDVQLSSVSMSPGLLDVFTTEHPPRLEFFKALPKYTSGKIWGVYMLVLEKDGVPFRLYVGSGTNVEFGIKKRLSCYRNGTVSEFSSLVRKAVTEEEFKITHVCLVCTAPIPPPGRVPIFRATIFALEAMFTFVLGCGLEQGRQGLSAERPSFVGLPHSPLGRVTGSRTVRRFLPGLRAGSRSSLPSRLLLLLLLWACSASILASRSRFCRSSLSTNCLMLGTGLLPE